MTSNVIFTSKLTTLKLSPINENNKLFCNLLTLETTHTYYLTVLENLI